MQDHIRFSRISHPRTSGFALLLLTVVFLSFGIAAEVNGVASAATTQEMAKDVGGTPARTGWLQALVR